MSQIMGVDLDAASRITAKVEELEDARRRYERGSSEWIRIGALVSYYRRRLRTAEKSEHETAHHARAHAAGLPAPFVVDDRGCWVWQRSLGTQGYGSLLFEGRQQRAHRLYFTRLVGDPGDMPLDHLCRNRGCVNPDHLEPVTAAENQRRGRSAKLNVEAVRNIKRALSLGVPQRRIADQYQVNQSTISAISRGRLWGDV